MKKCITRLFILSFAFLTACHPKIKEKKDEVYSRHLQKHVSITVISTPVPNNKSDFNLLLLNDGQEIVKFRVKEIVDSLFKKKLIQPLIVIGIDAFDRNQEYGIAGFPDFQGNGVSAEKYEGFIINELLPFIKKKSGVRKFNSVTIAGCELGGLSAFDIAWNHADKIDKVGVFSGAFALSDKEKMDSASSGDENRILFNKLKSSRKRPHLKYWFYAGSKGETSENPVNDVSNLSDTRDLIELIKKKKVSSSGDITLIQGENNLQDYNTWSHFLPQFLIWSVGK